MFLYYKLLFLKCLYWANPPPPRSVRTRGGGGEGGGWGGVISGVSESRVEDGPRRSVGG